MKPDTPNWRIIMRTSITISVIALTLLAGCEQIPDMPGSRDNDQIMWSTGGIPDTTITSVVVCPDPHEGGICMFDGGQLTSGSIGQMNCVAGCNQPYITSDPDAGYCEEQISKMVLDLCPGSDYKAICFRRDYEGNLVQLHMATPCTSLTGYTCLDSCD